MDQLPPQEQSPEFIAKQQVPIGTRMYSRKHLRSYLLAGLFLFFLLFGLYYLMTHSVTPTTKEKPHVATPTPTTTTVPTQPPDALRVMQFLPGKQYYNDSISIVTKNSPHQIILLSVTRAEQEADYFVYTTINYFDGTSWERESLTSTTVRPDIANNTIIRNWSSNLDIQGQGRKAASITVTLRNNVMKVGADAFNDEINLVSLPDYTKFIYQGGGKVVINNTEHEAYIAYTRAYSLNAASLSFFNNPSTLTSKSVTAWDEGGNFYVIDALSSKSASNPYQNYQISAVQNDDGAVTRASSLSVNQNANDPGRFQATIGKNSLDLAYLTSFNKAGVNESYVWILGPVDGSIRTSDAKSPYVLGILEYIEAKK